MNSVTPKRVEFEQIRKEGAGKGVVIFCCALFLFYQVAVALSAFFSSPPSTAQLAVISSQSLGLAAAPEQSQANGINRSLSSGNTHFSPFFFEPIAINSCDKKLLMSIKGIGPALAESILTTRNETGGFKKADDLLQVKGVGRSRLQQFSPYFTFVDASESE